MNRCFKKLIPQLVIAWGIVIWIELLLADGGLITWRQSLEINIPMILLCALFAYACYRSGRLGKNCDGQ